MLEMRVSTRAGRGQDTRIKLEDEQAQEQQKRKATPRRASNQAIPAIVRSPAKRTLDLDLSDVPLSDDFKYSKDFSEWDNKFWLDNFYTPKDNITKEYMKLSDHFNDFLPASFRLIEGEKEAFGCANLELKPNLVKPIKKIPLLSKLENGDYEIATSKSDKNIAASIKFFRNNLPHFQQYKDSDNIDWVITQHRQLVVDILGFYANKPTKPSLATIKSRFNAMTRIFRIAYETKNYQLYDKYAGLVLFLSNQFEADEHNNELSELELKKFVPFNIVLDKQKELQQQFNAMQNKNTIKAYDLNQNLVLLSLYSLIPPLRREIFGLKFSNTIQKQ